MNKIRALLIAIIFVFITTVSSNAQMMHGPGGMMGGLMGQGMDDGMMIPNIRIPEKIQKPQSESWLRQLDQVLALEKSSKVQYENDRVKHRASMPYMMVEPQEEYHIDLLTRLFKTYGVTPRAEIPAIKLTDSVEQAFAIAIELEADLIPRYESLIAGSEDGSAREVLGILLHQTKVHHRMFNHAMGMSGSAAR